MWKTFRYLCFQLWIVFWKSHCAFLLLEKVEEFSLCCSFITTLEVWKESSFWVMWQKTNNLCIIVILHIEKNRIKNIFWVRIVSYRLYCALPMVFVLFAFSYMQRDWIAILHWWVLYVYYLYLCERILSFIFIIYNFSLMFITEKDTHL
jgi:hypothetical protein